jgi:hypothetical protein
MRGLLFFIISLGSAFSFAADVTPRHALTGDELRQQAIQNHALSELPLTSHSTPWRPFAEYEKAGYVIFNNRTSFGSTIIKTEIAKNLPADVALIVTVRDENDSQNAWANYGAILGQQRFQTLKVSNGGETFWARDTSPEAVLLGSAEEPKVGLVLTHHRQGDLLAPFFSAFFGWESIESNYYLPGGNFLADAKGNCFMVENKMDNAKLTALHGCKTVTNFPLRHGIGHVDETLKLLSDNEALTDVPDYVATLETFGYRVQLLPRPSRHPNGTYANSLLVNGKLFLPVYGSPEDEQAIALYRGLGLDVHPLHSEELSDKGFGSIHCITMSYPRLDMKGLQGLRLALHQ